MADEYVFPFDTCELADHNSIFAQPYSASVNIVSILVILYFLTQCHRSQTIAFFVALLAFEVWHTLSHCYHMESRTLQIRVIHALAYALNATILLAVIALSGSMPSTTLIVVLLALIAFDAYSFIRLPMVFYFASQAAIVSVTILAYAQFAPDGVRTLLLCWLLPLIALLLAMFVNESYNCRAMLKWAPFPYHAVLEGVGVVAFIVFGMAITRWDKSGTLRV
jgi:hypothetical protein